MSSRTAGANRAIRAAWENEKSRVLEGKGTRDWTEEQQEQIIGKGKAYDDQGRAFEGQHMKSVSAYPEYQDDTRNIQFLSRDEHLAAHRGNWKHQTNGYYDPGPKTMSDFGDGPPRPCAVMPLTNPMYSIPTKVPSKKPSRSGSESVNALNNTNSVPKVKLPQWTQSLQRVVVQASKDPRVWSAVVSGAWIAKERAAAVNQRRSAGGNRTTAPSEQSPMRATPEVGTNSLRGARRSPEEHPVSGYTRKGGTTVRPYRRGGKKD